MCFKVYYSLGRWDSSFMPGDYIFFLSMASELLQRLPAWYPYFHSLLSILSTQTGFFFFLAVLGFELRSCYAVVPLLEPHLQPFLLWLFWR
jgi:hypothetical protein